MQVNYVLVVGAEEEENKTVNVRPRGTGTGQTTEKVMQMEEFLAKVEQEIRLYQ